MRRKQSYSGYGVCLIKDEIVYWLRYIPIAGSSSPLVLAGTTNSEDKIVWKQRRSVIKKLASFPNVDYLAKLGIPEDKFHLLTYQKLFEYLGYRVTVIECFCD